MCTDAANNCKHVGYDEFEPASWPSSCAPSKSQWVLTEKRILCGTDGAYPEEFWQCSDIKIEFGKGSPRVCSFKRNYEDFGESMFGITRVAAHVFYKNIYDQ